MGSKTLIELAKQGKAALGKWRQANPDTLLNLSDAKLRDVNLRGANLKRAELTGADLRGADLVGAQFAEADLTRADLRGAKLVKADFYSAKLFRASLAEADCSGAYFRRADMTQCDLSQADLTKADLMDADLTKALLTNAILIGAELTRTKLAEVDVANATVGWTSFCSLDLSQTFGLDQLRHLGPSILGLDTATRSHGVLSTSFLQGCGLAEGVIQQWKTLFGHPAENVPCYIRSAPEDAAFAQHLLQAAQAKGNIAALFSDDDYPESAKSRGEQGTTSVALTIGTDGRVAGCSINSSSGSNTLDSTTCSVIKRRARYSPAKDQNGQPIQGTGSARIKWVLPSD